MEAIEASNPSLQRTRLRSPLNSISLDHGRDAYLPEGWSVNESGEAT